MSSYGQYLSMVAALKSHLPDLLGDLGMLRGGKTFRCPHSLLPPDHQHYHRDRNPSASYTSDGTCFYCHTCHATGDIINLCQLYYHVDWVGAVYFLHGKYVLGLPLDPPIANMNPEKYKVQFAAKYREDKKVVRQKVKKVKEKSPNVIKENGVMWNPPIIVSTPEDYRVSLIEEASRIIGAGHGVVLYEPTADDRKVPMNLPEQRHGFSEPITNIEVLRSVVNREIQTEEDVETRFLAVALQNNLLCIDADEHAGKHGLRNLRGLEIALGEDLPLKTYEFTRSAGRHFYFRLPKDFDIIARDGLEAKVGGKYEVDGIDILAGNYAVITAPSTGYARFDGGERRGWKSFAKLPQKWLKLLSANGPKITELCV